MRLELRKLTRKQLQIIHVLAPHKDGARTGLIKESIGKSYVRTYECLERLERKGAIEKIQIGDKHRYKWRVVKEAFGVV